jgi:hypothetical protein
MLSQLKEAESHFTCGKVQAVSSTVFGTDSYSFNKSTTDAFETTTIGENELRMQLANSLGPKVTICGQISTINKCPDLDG